GVPHVQAAWGEIELTGGFSATSAPATLKTDSLIALAPRARWTQPPALLAGKMPSSDYVNQVCLSASEAAALGFTSPSAAICKKVNFNVGRSKPATLTLVVVGVVSDVAMPSGVSGALAPYQLMSDQWVYAA